MKSKRPIILSLLILLSLLTVSCEDEDKKNINVSYGVCSKMYNCSSEFTGVLANAIHFWLPKNHNSMYITFITDEAGEFQQDLTAAASPYPPATGYQYIGDRAGTFNAQGNTFGFDAASAAISAVAAGVDVFIAYYETGDSRVAVRRAMEILSGYTNVTYHYVVYDSNKKELFSGTAPGGIKVTLFCGRDADRIDFYATESGNIGQVAYENAYQVDDKPTDVNGGKSEYVSYQYYGEVEITVLDEMYFSCEELEDKYGKALVVGKSYSAMFYQDEVRMQQVHNNANNLSYIFMTFGPGEPFQEGICYRIEGKLEDIVDRSLSMDITEFTSVLKSAYFPSSYKIWKGTADGIEGEHIFADVNFNGDNGSGENSSGYGGRLRIILEDDYNVRPDSFAQLEIVAG